MHLFQQLKFFLEHPFTPLQSSWTFILVIVLGTLGFIGVMWLLHLTSPTVKKWLTIGCTFIAGLFFMLEFLLPTTTKPDGSVGNVLTPWVEPTSQYVVVIVVWTVFLGIISLFIVHGKRLQRAQAGWHNSLAFFLAFVAMLFFGFMTMTGKAQTIGALPKPIVAGFTATYASLFNGMLINLDAAMFALLAFYIASAAYRAFRVRTVEAALLMASALLVMLGMVHIGVAMTSWIPPDSGWAYFRLENVMLWILNWLNMPGQRAITIGVAVGALAMALRVWLSLEQRSFFAKEK